ncbi:MAG: N-acetyltransferase family protein [Gaiellaceae bacterium]
MEVRLAGPDDADAVAEVFTASFETLSFLPMLHIHAQHRAFIGGLIEKDEAWVAEDGGRIIGMAVLSAEMLDQLYVHPDAQGRGAGSALLEKAKERRPEGFTFWVFQQNEDARRFYEQRGCRLVRLTDGSRNEEKTPDALYEWKPEENA